MADLLWWLGYTTETTAMVVVRSDTAGAITLSGVDNDGPKTAAAGTNDGAVVFQASGLVSGRRYPFTLTHADGSSESGTLKASPMAAPYYVTFGSCQQNNAILQAGYQMAALDPAAYINLGDMIYSNSAGTHYGETTAVGDTTLTSANFNAMHRQCRRNPGNQHVMQRIPSLYMWDDHELFGSNWDGTLAAANDQGAGLADQAAADAAFVTVRECFENYSIGNPPNNDADAINEKAPDADAGTPASNYPPQYFRFTIGPAEFFVLDCMSHREDYTVDGTMLGVAGQKAWLYAHLAASTATFKVIMSPKKTYKNSGWDNGDMWDKYATERDEVIATIEAASGWAVPGGVIWCSGDRHTPGIEASYNGVGIASADHLCVNGCPLSVEINADQGAIGTLLDQGAYTRQISPQWQQVFGCLYITDDYVEASIRSAYSGKVLWNGQVLAGSNALHYPSRQVAI